MMIGLLVRGKKNARARVQHFVRTGMLVTMVNVGELVTDPPRRQVRWPRVLAVLALICLLVTLALGVTIVISHWTALRTGWVSHSQDSQGAAIRSYELFFRHGRVTIHSEFHWSGGVTIEQLLQRESYQLQTPGWQWHTFPATWTNTQAPARGGGLLQGLGIELINRSLDPRVRKLRSIDARDVGIDLPGWMLIVPTLLMLGILTIAIVRKRRRLREGCCVTCGYDLRASPERCPECGTPVPNHAPP
jgi:hypothetical protein